MVERWSVGFVAGLLALGFSLGQMAILGDEAGVEKVRPFVVAGGEWHHEAMRCGQNDINEQDYNQAQVIVIFLRRN